MQHLFDIERTVRVYSRYFDEQVDELRQLLYSVQRSLQRLLPPEVSRRIDVEGSRLHRAADGTLSVERHPDLEAARRELAKLGLFRIFAPQQHGGFELPVAVYYLAVQLVSTFDTSLALVFLVHGNAMYIIERYGTEAQRQRYLPALASGEQVATVAFTEPQAGSDAGSIRSRATRDGDDYVLAGDKLFITNGGDADILVATARTGSPDKGVHGVSTFIVEREADGVEVLGLEDKTALNGSPTAALSFSEVRIPSDRLLGEIDHGGQVMFAGVGMTRVNIGAQAIGIAKRAFDAAVDFALQRSQGGALIIEHDAIQQRLSDMALMISAMENLVCHVSRLELQGQWHVREMSIAKYYCSEALQELTLRAINVFGGYGISRDYPVERCRREAVALPLYGGTSEIQWYIIARELLDSLAGRHADYHARDEQSGRELTERCAGDADLVALADRFEAMQQQLWESVAVVATRDEPVPFYRHLAEGATAVMVAQVLLYQASAPNADPFEVELATLAIDRSQSRLETARGRIDEDVTGGRLKSIIRDLLDS